MRNRSHLLNLQEKERMERGKVTSLKDYAKRKISWNVVYAVAIKKNTT